IEHGETGILVPPRDVDALADALRVLLPDELLRKHLALVAEDRLERLFSADVMAERTIKVYTEFSQ
ncbi:MAG: glycosyltransferase, partial [Aggregatilineales bacterium]